MIDLPAPWWQSDSCFGYAAANLLPTDFDQRSVCVRVFSAIAMRVALFALSKRDTYLDRRQQGGTRRQKLERHEMVGAPGRVTPVLAT